jgi:protease II
MNSSVPVSLVEKKDRKRRKNEVLLRMSGAESNRILLL